MRILRGVFRLLIGISFMFLGIQLILEMDYTASSDIGELALYLSSITYAIYQLLMAFYDFLEKKKVYSILFWFAALIPIALPIVFLFQMLESNLDITEISVFIFGLLMLSLHVFDFFFYRNPFPEQLSEMGEIIDF